MYWNLQHELQLEAFFFTNTEALPLKSNELGWTMRIQFTSATSSHTHIPHVFKESCAQSSLVKEGRELV